MWSCSQASRSARSFASCASVGLTVAGVPPPPPATATVLPGLSWVVASPIVSSPETVPSEGADGWNDAGVYGPALAVQAWRGQFGHGGAKRLTINGHGLGRTGARAGRSVRRPGGRARSRGIVSFRELRGAAGGGLLRPDGAGPVWRRGGG